MSLFPGNKLPKFDNSLGALLIGGMVAMALWGVTCVQSYSYFTSPSKDRPFIKFTVAFLLILDTFDSALNTHILYHYMVTNYVNPFALLVPVWSIIIHVTITPGILQSLSNFIIRTMFALRIYRLSKGNRPLTGWIMAVSTTDLVVGLVITVKAAEENFGAIPSVLWTLSPPFLLLVLQFLMYLTFAVGTTSDLSLALALCYLLHRSRTGFRKTDSLIKVLILYTVNTGMIVALDASLGMIMYVLMPDNLIFLGIYLLLSKLYLNSYLAALNARRDLRDKGDDTPVSIHLSQISQTRRFDIEGNLPSVNEKSRRTSNLAISIETLVDRKVDYAPPATNTGNPHPFSRSV
ncbi:uncharacterized protein LACBIDRAFT_315197 [Laccaria bicolor S238N-H82]|uniref:Predicted protein n=1 Tax=Laccaria bicolor (strain S238N-H82 / ATCC MYA-4686) TaxID=486041 RepID=B0E022_LACBS|nr:uncharacterized protein LACBIDRAFT_315197 [Laccaria bicolor S238N-H82]EDQ99821.1 predicted protein [Laccaria bicolor S238N-H82]|eukprot:XP_001889513.1 predicted protein [Laccaria bicolor S238N-H82]